MAGILHELENNEAILLMYLADELPAEDRGEVESLLRTDGALRADLEGMRALQASVMADLRMADGGEAALAGGPAAARRVMREMRRRKLEQKARPAAAEVKAPARAWPWWTYPAAAAAAAIFLLIGLWGFGVIELPGQGDNRISERGPIVNPTPDEDTPAAPDVAKELERSLANGLDETEHRVRALNGEEDALVFLTRS